MPQAEGVMQEYAAQAGTDRDGAIPQQDSCGG